MDLGIYCIQVSRYVLGEEPCFVTAQIKDNVNKIRFSEVEESITFQLVFPSGAIANCFASFGVKVDRFFASAERGTFELSPALTYGSFKGKKSDGEFNFPNVNQQQVQLDEICKKLLENKRFPNHISGEEGLKDLIIIEALYRAARNGQKVYL